ncbi:hypothetical protein NW762_008389 [Fusarium torreyae]|uniref:Uncharacterized protein n=1 Tax=Fusarium torreyae TaxID=1237075 RepID=A0A9W8RZD9_9HYPO|nr:hypothetical protein NW762_008389 [Fusarium torreyae]
MAVSTQWTTIITSALPLLQQILSRLKKVIFVFEGGDRRMYLDWHYTRSIDLPRQDLPWQLYHSGPIMTRVLSFDRLTPGPQSIRRYLRKLSLSSHDPLVVFETWLNRLQDFGVDYVDGSGIFFVSYMCCRPEIIDRADAVGWVKGEAEQRTATLQRE